MQVLIIDDDPVTTQSLSAALTLQGLEVQCAGDGQAGMSAVRVGSFDLILLDVMLPCQDGFSLLQTLRQADNQTPVIFLTARGAVEDRIRGLELGADDYITKPFSPDEVLARIRTVLRRLPGRAAPHNAAAQVIRIGDLELDLHRRRALRAGRRLVLTPKEFSLLSLLARRHGQALSRTFIADEVWDGAFEKGTNVVDVHIRRLRAKLDDPFEQKLIVTLRGVGYMLTDVASLPPGSPGTLDQRRPR